MARRSARRKRLQDPSDKDTIILNKMPCLDTNRDSSTATGSSGPAVPNLGNFSKLPREVRDMIYAFSIPPPATSPKSRKTRKGGFRSLLCASRIINAEASSLKEIGQRPFNVFISARTGPNCGRGTLNFDNLFRVTVCTSTILDSSVISDQQRTEEHRLDEVCAMLRNFQHPPHHPKRAPIKINLFVDVPTSVCWSTILLNHMSGLVTSFTSLLSICLEDNGPRLEISTIDFNLTLTPWTVDKTVTFTTEALDIHWYSTPLQRARLELDKKRFPSPSSPRQHPCYFAWSVCYVLSPMYIQALGTTGKDFTVRVLTSPSTLYGECGWSRSAWKNIDNSRRWKTKLRLLEIGLGTLSDLMGRGLIINGSFVDGGGGHSRRQIWRAIRQILLRRWEQESVALDVITEDEEADAKAAAEAEAETQQGWKRVK